MKDYKVVGCLLFADGDLVTHGTVPFALVYVGYKCVFNESLSNNSSSVYLLADGGHARVANTVRRPRRPFPSQSTVRS